MLKRMQPKYAGKPVRFLLIPCNQFGAQEPGANSAVKAFAEQSVHLGPGSGVVMLAKSSLNGVACNYEGADACAPSSTECCPKNDGVYEYLLANTPPGTIDWNFDKIIVGVDGKPYKGETILKGPALDAELSSIIDGLLTEAKFQKLLAAPRPHLAFIPMYLLSVAAVCSAAILLLARALGFEAAWRSAGDEHEPSSGYYLVA